MRPEWDCNTTEGKESLRVYHQALLAGLKATSRKPTIKVKRYDVRQEKSGNPTACLDRLMVTFKQFSPYDPESEEV